MIRTFLAAGAAVFTLAAAAAADIPPFNPPPEPIAPAGTTIGPDEVRFTPPGGPEIDSGRFAAVRSLNGEWLCSGLERSATPFPAGTDAGKGCEKPGFDDSKWDKIAVPLNWYRKYPKIYKEDEPYVKGWYRKTIDLTAAELRNKAVLLRFGTVGYEATLWVNGEKAGSHHGDFVPWEIDITRFLKPGKNLLALQVFSDFGPARSKIRLGARTYGSQWSVSNIKGGIWQDVDLVFTTPVRIERLLVTPHLAGDTVELDYRIENPADRPVDVAIGAAVTTALKTGPNKLNAAAAPETLRLRPGRNAGSISVRLKNPVRWEPGNPFLYYATLYLLQDGRPLTARSERFGFRDFTIRNGKFHLNGRRIYLFGENLRSVNFGGLGDEEANRKHLIDKLQGFKSLGYNIIRNAHMPALPELYRYADEIGLMIYDEWGWCFTNFIDEPEFSKRNPVELEEWLVRDYNHPSVVLWSCGNEVVHRDNPSVQRQLDRQVELVRAFDKQKRPAGSFSGSASWTSYGRDPRTTDFLDLHSYIGNGGSPWTIWNRNFDTMYNGSLRDYKIDGSRLPMPYIIWECVGFSWGGMTDRSFRPNDMKQYAKYAAKPTSWGEPNGIGYSGTIGLAKALQPGSMDYAKEVYGKRLLELMRQDERIDGFAPWFHGYRLKAATLWNQPVLVGLRDEQSIMPRGLFSGRENDFTLYIADSTDRPVPAGTAELTCVTADGRELPAGTFPTPAAEPFRVATAPVRFRVPDGVRGDAQLRLVLKVNGREISRNFYDCFVQDPAILTAPVRTAKRVVVLDTGSREDAGRTGAVLKQLGIPFAIVPGSASPGKADVAIIPAAEENAEPMKIDRKALFDWVRQGGTLLVLEQSYITGPAVNDMAVLTSGNTFVDLVHPAHPVFKGLSQKNFDTWSGAKDGFVISGGIAPFSVNALAVKGPMLGGRSIETAILEAAVGKGAIFWTQLNATALWGKESSASTYLRNVLEYVLGTGRFDKIEPLAANQDGSFPAVEKNLVPLDLTGHANRSFTDEADNDGKGGWTDQGSNDFRNMPLGRQKAAGVLFEIIDPAKNGGKSCIVLRGTERPNFPDAARGIPVNGRFSRLFFLHTAAWDGAEAGRYRMHYADGSTVDYPLIPGVNIGDWWNCGYLSSAMPGILRPNLSKEVGTYVAAWENPFPEKEIKTMDFLSASCPDANTINFDPSKTPVPVLIAATGERANPAPLAIDTAAKPGVWSKGGNTVKGAPLPVQSDKTAVLPDGSTGRVREITFPKASGQEAPYTFVKFDPSPWDGREYHYLTFWLKTPTAGALDLAVAEKDWESALRKSVTVGGDGPEWRKIRIPLPQMGLDKMKGRQLRGEFFLYNGSNRRFRYPRPAITFQITGIELE